MIKEYGLPLADMARFMGKDPKTVKDFLGIGKGKASEGADCHPAEDPITDDVPRDENPAGGETRPRAGRRRRAFLPEQRPPRQPCEEEEFVMDQELLLARAEAQNVIDARRIELLEDELSKAQEQQERDDETIRQLRREIGEASEQQEQ